MPTRFAGRIRGPFVRAALFALVLGCQGNTKNPKENILAADPAEKRTATAPSHGYGEGRIAWRSLDEGLAESARDGRPLMLLVHASWCSRCKALKPQFNENDNLAELSDRFVMVNADQDQVPAVLSYAPDGTYIPRVLFISPVTGEVDEGLLNPERAKFKYFYAPGHSLVDTMRKALDQYGAS